MDEIELCEYATSIVISWLSETDEAQAHISNLLEAANSTNPIELVKYEIIRLGEEIPREDWMMVFGLWNEVDWQKVFNSIFKEN